MVASAKVMKGTEFENNWFFYHDTLSLMTSKTTKDWMKGKGYYKRCIRPSNDLYKNKPELLTKFKDNPIGNSPEFMPWDNHLNQDVHS